MTQTRSDASAYPLLTRSASAITADNGQWTTRGWPWIELFEAGGKVLSLVTITTAPGTNNDYTGLEPMSTLNL